MLKMEVGVRVHRPVAIKIEIVERMNAHPEPRVRELRELVVEDRLPVVRDPELRVVTDVVLRVHLDAGVRGRKLRRGVREPGHDRARVGGFELAEADLDDVPRDLHELGELRVHLRLPAGCVGHEVVVVLDRGARPELHDRADAHAARVGVRDDRLGVGGPGRKIDGREERPLHVVLSRLHQPIDDLLRVGEVRGRRLVEDREVLDRVEGVKLKPPLRNERRALHVEGKREGGRPTPRDELLLRVEEAHAELLEERVRAKGEVRGVLRIDHDRSRACRAADSLDRVPIRDRDTGLGRGGVADGEPDRPALREGWRRALDGHRRTPGGAEVAREVQGDGVEKRVHRIEIDPHVRRRDRLERRAQGRRIARRPRARGRRGRTRRTGKGDRDCEERRGRQGDEKRADSGHEPGI